jgi:phytoene/squalene synthetase
VRRDYERGRIYLPQESWQAAGYDESQFARHEYNAAFRELLATEVDFADRELCAGMELVPNMPRALRAQVWLFAQGGRTILANIRRAEYNVWRRRPTVSRSDQLRLVLGYLWRRAKAQD